MIHPHLLLRAARLLAVLLLLPAVPGLAAQTPRPVGPLPLDAFAYDRAAPLLLRDSLERVEDGVEVRRISFASPGGGRATGVLLVPPGEGRFAGLLLQHGMPGSAQRMVPWGVRLARQGAVVVALDAPFARRTGPILRFTPADSAEQVALIVEMQRAVDLLLARPDVDSRRLAYVGHSYGGAMGALLAGVERRMQTFVLRVADGGLVAHLTGPDDRPGPLDGLSPEARRRWLAAMMPIEPSRFIGRPRRAPVLFQSARRDVLVPPSDAEALHRAARGPKTVRWYDAGHGLNEEAEADLAEWLHRMVGMEARRGM